MINAIKSIRTQSPFLPISLHPSSCLDRKASSVGFKQASTTTQPTEPESDHEMDEKSNSNAARNPHIKAEDLMSHSFGEGYATRCEDDGFGEVHGGNQTVAKADNEELIHENHPAYDMTQGSEVKEKEKEKARNQMEPKTN